MRTTASFLVLLALLSFAHAGPRTSANYSIVTDITDGGGKRTTSTAYTNDGSAGAVVGFSSVASPAETVKNGFIGQLFDITGLVVNAGSPSVNETATLQLAAWQLLDDSSLLAVSSANVTWSVQSGPVTGVSAAGVATGGTVFQDTSATVQGIFGGFAGSLNLTVLDTVPDNFGSYAGDGIGDDWQVQFFGLNNPNAAPGFISDGSGLTNLFKYTAGLIPNNAASTFTLNTQAVAGHPTQRNVIFGPAFASRQYTIESSSDLIHFGTLSGPSAGNDGTMTINDANAGGGGKFYRVKVTKP